MKSTLKDCGRTAVTLVAVAGAFALTPAKHAVAESSRISVAPEVQLVLNADTPEGRLARAWVRYARGLVGEAGIRIEDVVTPDVHCIELEAAGYPSGPSGLEQFRREINAAFPDESVYIADMRFVGADTVETELHARGTHLGPLLGREPTGRAVSFVIRTLNRFEGDRMAERWDRADFAGLLRQLE